MVRFLIKVKLIVDRILIGYLEISEGEVDFIEYKTKKKNDTFIEFYLFAYST